MAVYKDVMRWVAELDVTKAVRGLREIETEGKKALDGVSDEVDNTEGKMSSGFKGIGGKIGNGLIAGFGAIGVGAALAQSLQASWDKAGGIRQITGQFRLSVQEAARYGREAGKVYGSGWGESLPEVQQVVALAGERLEDATGKTLGKITEQILAVSQTWGADYEAVIRSITQLTENGLAPNSKAALDLIVTGFQDGLDEAGDFLDTIDEYSQHWEAMGLDGEDALNQIKAGFEGGQRDADKLADAVKEMRIRVVEDTDAITDAYTDLGLDADELRIKFLEGGESARDAFLTVINALRDVEDPVEQNRLAVELIGTQYEDLGPKALDALASVEGQLRETQGAAQDLADVVGERSPWDRLKRHGSEAATAIGDRFARLVLGDFGGANEVLEDLTEQAEALGDEVYESSRKAGRATRDYGDDSKYLADEQDELKRITQLAEDATRRKADADREAEEAARKHREEIKHTRDEIGKLKREIDDRQAWLSLQDTFDDTVAKLTDVESTTREQEQAMLDLKEETLEYAESIDLPDRVTTDIIALIDEGKLAEAQALLERFGDGITVPLRPKLINTGGARIRMDEFGNLQSYHDGGVVAGPRGSEQLAVLKAGETVLPTHKSGADSGGQKWGAVGVAPPNVTYGPIIVEAPYGSNPDEFGRRIMEAIRREERWRGPR